MESKETAHREALSLYFFIDNAECDSIRIGYIERVSIERERVFGESRRKEFIEFISMERLSLERVSR